MSQIGPVRRELWEYFENQCVGYFRWLKKNGADIGNFKSVPPHRLRKMWFVFCSKTESILRPR